MAKVRLLEVEGMRDAGSAEIKSKSTFFGKVVGWVLEGGGEVLLLLLLLWLMG